MFVTYLSSRVTQRIDLCLLSNTFTYLPIALFSTHAMSTTQPASASPMPPGVTDPNYKPLPGRLGNLTVVQLHALETLKKKLNEENKFVPERMDDATLLRSVFYFESGKVSCALVLVLAMRRWQPLIDLLTDSFALGNSTWTRQKKCFSTANNGGKTLV